MTKYASFQIGDGDDDIVVVEIDEDDSGDDLVPVSRDNPDGMEVVETGKDFARTMDKLRPIIGILKSRLDSMTDPADEVAVEFGVKLSGEVGMILTKAAAETTFKISMKWTKDKS